MNYEKYKQAVENLNQLRANHRSNSTTERARQTYRFYKFYERDPENFSTELESLIKEVEADPGLKEELQYVLDEQEAADAVMHSFN